MPSAPMTKVSVTMRNPGRHVLGLILLCLPVASSASLQAASRRTEQKAEQRPLMAEDVFKNVQLLKGIPVKEFMNTMGFFSAATNLNCIDCHSAQRDTLEGYAIDTPRKQMARKMIVMLNTLWIGKLSGVCQGIRGKTRSPASYKGFYVDFLGGRTIFWGRRHGFYPALLINSLGPRDTPFSYAPEFLETLLRRVLMSRSSIQYFAKNCPFTFPPGSQSNRRPHQ
jgi:hypothetical protein